MLYLPGTISTAFSRALLRPLPLGNPVLFQALKNTLLTSTKSTLIGPLYLVVSISLYNNTLTYHILQKKPIYYKFTYSTLNCPPKRFFS